MSYDTFITDNFYTTITGFVPLIVPIIVIIIVFKLIWKVIR